jgi:hypothetical protein
MKNEIDYPLPPPPNKKQFGGGERNNWVSDRRILSSTQPTKPERIKA